MLRSKKVCVLPFALKPSCLIFFLILAHLTVITLAMSGEESNLRGNISHLSKMEEKFQISYDNRFLENDASHSGHSRSDHSHSGHSHSGDEVEGSNSTYIPAVVSDASEESEYQMNLASASYEKKPLSTVIVACVSMLYAGVAFGIFLLIRLNEKHEDDHKNIPLVNREEVELVNSFSNVTQKHRCQTSDGSDALTYVVDDTVSLPSMKTINDEKKLAEKCCAIIGVQRPTGLA